jgi:hypothetical protein
MLTISMLNDLHRLITDDENPRIYIEEWACVGCGRWTNHEMVVWWDRQRRELSAITGDPFCPGCCPKETENA